MEINRFTPFKKERGDRFLLNNYTSAELDYCFSFKDPVPHLAGTFAAKEAVFKAIGQDHLLFSSIEIRREPNGRPSVWIKNRRQKKVLVSISHTNKNCMAVAHKNE